MSGLLRDDNAEIKNRRQEETTFQASAAVGTAESTSSSNFHRPPRVALAGGQVCLRLGPANISKHEVCVKLTYGALKIVGLKTRFMAS